MASKHTKQKKKERNKKICGFGLFVIFAVSAVGFGAVYLINPADNPTQNLESTQVLARIVLFYNETNTVQRDLYFDPETTALDAFNEIGEVQLQYDETGTAAIAAVAIRNETFTTEPGFIWQLYVNVNPVYMAIDQVTVGNQQIVELRYEERLF